MKKFLAMWIGALLLFSAQAKADSCPAGKYWNSVEKTCAYATACISPTEVVYKSKRYKLNNDGSFKTNDDGTFVEEEFYESTYTCGNCEKGFSKMWIKFHPLPDWIVKCQSCPSGCKECNTYYPGSDPFIQITTCTVCKSGYTLSNGACIEKPACSNGQYTASDGTCQPCSNISVPNGSCLSCSSSSQCDNISCNTGYVKKGGTCVKAATCTYPLKEVTDYSGECAGCCTD